MNVKAFEKDFLLDIQTVYVLIADSTIYRRNLDEETDMVSIRFLSCIDSETKEMKYTNGILMWPIERDNEINPYLGQFHKEKIYKLNVKTMRNKAVKGGLFTSSSTYEFIRPSSNFYVLEILESDVSCPVLEKWFVEYQNTNDLEDK